MAIIRRITKREGTAQINLPQKIRDRLELQIGDYMFMHVDDKSNIIMFKIDFTNYPALRQLLPPGDPQRFDEPRD